jgi:hypothetical protein
MWVNDLVGAYLESFVKLLGGFMRFTLFIGISS